MPSLDKMIEEKAEKYPAYYELRYMNADTPRLSGSEYLIDGYKAGAEFITTDLKALSQVPEVKALIDALKVFSCDHLNSKGEDYGFGCCYATRTLKPWKVVDEQ